MRLFVAAVPQYMALDALEEARDGIKEQCPACRFTPRENMHLTLAFIGEAGPKLVEEAKKAMDSLDLESFTARVQGSGRFGDTAVAFMKKDRKLAELRKAVVDALDEFGVPYDRKPFTPHITLARKVPPDVTRPSVDTEFEINRVLLMNSRRVDGKLTYTPIYEKSLD
ncbi:MAG: RNA 2',3'-cyclic phosphodiesterase [Oscillospiraceae bacterium]|jgi:2'-5' RNA ligase